MTAILIQRRIYLEPKYLDQDIMSHILAKIQKKIVGECTKEYGHILNVTKIVKIIDNEDNVFTVCFEANTLKPSPGIILEGTVCMIIPDGIFINILEKQQMLIPSTSLQNYTYNSTNGTFVSKNKKLNSIKIGDVIKAKVSAYKYTKKTFSCFGSIV